MKIFSKILLSLPLLLLAAPASADSPLTSTNVPSKVAAHVAPAPYTGATVTRADAAATVKRALTAVKETHASPTVGFAIAQRINAADMSHPGTAAAFKTGLTALKRQTNDPAEKTRIGLIRGVTTSLDNPDNATAKREVNKAARELKGDARVQVVAGVVSAQRAAFGKTANWDKPTKLWRQADQRFAQAAADAPNALTRKTLGSAEGYLKAYPGFKQAQAAAKPAAH